MDLRDQCFGIEAEMTGVTRQMVAEVTTQYSGTLIRYPGTHYNTCATTDNQRRQQRFVSDGSIAPQQKVGERKATTDNTYRAEMVSLICRYEDVITIQQTIRKLKEAGTITNSSYSIHVYIDASPFDTRTLRDITNIMVVKEGLIYKALKVSVSREHSYCRKMEQRFLNDLNARRPRSMAGVERTWYGGESESHSHRGDNRHHCLNLHSVFQKGTAEFRLSNGTLHVGKIKAYIQFCLTIDAQAPNQRCASRRRTQTTNEKHTFRTWLLRFGLNGDESAITRQYLLANLPNYIAWWDPTQAEA